MKTKPKEKSQEKMNVSYVINHDVKPAELATLFENSGISRPKDISRLSKMITNANLIIAARENRKLVGVLRALTDFSYSCYVSDLAVDRKYQGKGIGKELLQIARETLGNEVMILLLSSPEADSFYPHYGFEKARNAWSLPRKK
ncbi:MAG: GNAT family N-acetyltransferase [Nitrosotalea sp.]